VKVTIAFRTRLLPEAEPEIGEAVPAENVIRRGMSARMGYDAR
jgi:hypothetical protein